VKVNGDPAEEPDEIFHVALTGVTSGPGVLDATPSVDATIVNDDVTAHASVSDAQVTEGNAGTKSIVFTVTLDQAATGVIKLAYATTDGTAIAGSDYTAATGVVSLAAGVTTKTFTISVIGDRVVEPDETFTVTLTGVTQGPATIVGATATGTIVDND
jgi:Calx-beta domain